MFLGGGPSLSLVFRAVLWVLALLDRTLGCVGVFVRFHCRFACPGPACVLRVFCARALVLHVFCKCFVNQSESE